MKAVLMSIQPKWCELIASGKKTIEVRKTKPKIDVPFKCYIYCTDKKPSDNEWQYKPNLYLDKVENKVRWIDVEFTRTYNCEYLQQRVIGEFVCDDIDKIAVFNDLLYCEKNTQANKLMQMCLTVEEIKAYLGSKNLGYNWHISNLVIYEKPMELSEFRYASVVHTTCFGIYTKRVTRPPQSWCYVKEV